MPWKGEKDPYKIWLSEIILQQTRVEQGLAYYQRFVAAFPTVKDLALAPEIKVFKLWEGLGYYTRCKNLIASAKYVHTSLGGRFPETYEAILALKGVGPYTAAAIGSFAFNLPNAVVDGNVFRVLSRYFGIDVPTDSSKGKKLFSDLANNLIDKTQPGIYNQALMDFGAVICKPKLPACNECILQQHCTAFLQGSTNQLPVKEKSILKRSRWFYYLVLDFKGSVYVRKRGGGDIWENLYEFILIELNEAVQLDSLQPVKEFFGDGRFEVNHISNFYTQQLTHQTIHGRFIQVKIEEPFTLIGYKPVSKKALEKLPFPKFITNYLKDKNVSLNLF